MRDHALAVPDVFVGRVNLTTIRTGEVFLDAVRRHSPGIILVHNHPLRGPCTER
jgi:DNA repair protein RadC